MPVSRKRFIVAVMALIGTVIGVGIFGVPYAMSTVGLGITLAYFVLLGGIQLLQSLYFAEAIIACDEHLRFPGLVKKYMGEKAKRWAAMSVVLGFWGGLVAYVLVGGVFLHTLFSPFIGGSVMAYQLGWALVGGGAVFLGLEFVSKIDFVSTVTLFLAMTLISFLALPHVEIPNFALYVPNGDLFLPYGVILFSLGGFAAIPEMEDILKNDHGQYRRAIAAGQVAAAVLTFVFGLIVYGVSGTGTTPDAVGGLQPILGGPIAAFMAAFGFLAVATSYFIIGVNLRATFEYDYGVPWVKASFLAAGVPLAFVLLGAKDFIGIVSFSGAVFGGIGATIVVLLYLAVRKQHRVENHAIITGHKGDKPLRLPLWMAYVTMAVLLFGAGYSVYTSVMKLLG